MKKFIILAILALATSVQAAVLTTNIAAAGTNNVLAGHLRLNQLTFINASTNILTLRIQDAAATTFTYTNAGYTSISIGGPTNVITSYTNTFGAVESWTNAGVYYVTNVVGAFTNQFPTLVYMQVAPSATVAYTPVGPMVVMGGLLLTNDNAMSLVVDYVNLYP